MFQTELLCVGDVLFVQLSTKFISVQSLSRIWVFATPWTAASQASLSITNCQNLLKLMSIESVMPSSHLTLCRPLLLLPSVLSQHQGYYLIIFIGEILKRAWALKIALHPTRKTSLTNTAVLEKLCKPFEITMLLFNNPENCCGASPSGSAGKEPTCNAGDLGSIPGLERIFVRSWTPIPMCMGCPHSYQVILGHRLDVLQLNSILTLPGDTVRSRG